MNVPKNVKIKSLKVLLFYLGHLDFTHWMNFSQLEEAASIMLFKSVSKIKISFDMPRLIFIFASLNIYICLA